MEYLFTSSLLLCLVLSWILFLAFHSIRRGSKSSSAKLPLPPGPRTLPIFGNLFDLGDKPHRSMFELAKTHGPLMSLKLGSLFTVVVSSDTLAKEVMQKHDLTFSNRNVVDAIRASQHHEFGMGWIPVSPLWRTLRKVCNTHLLTTQKLDANQYLRRKKIQQLTAYVQNCCHTGEAINIGQAAFEVVLNLLSNTILSMDLVDPNSPNSQEFKKTVWGVAEEGAKPNWSDYFPILRRIDPQGIRRRMTNHFEKLLDLFGKMFDERLQSRKMQGFTSSPSPSHDVLDTLLDIIEGNIEELDKRSVAHLLLIIFVAGADTSAATVEWAMTELLRNPEVLVKAKKELEQVIGKGNPVEESDINRLPYLQAIIKETFRIHPVGPLLLPRRCGADTEIGGFTIPEGAQVLVNVWAIGRDPSIWENPNVFMPERFLGSEIDFKGRDFRLLPFGAGRRMCPGLPLANRMLHLMLGSLIHFFDWKVEGGIGMSPKDIDVEEKFGITLLKVKPLRAVPSIPA